MGEAFIAEAAVAQGRLVAEALMSSLCIVRRPGPLATDPETGVVAPSLVVVYEGKCRVQSSDIGESTADAGGHRFVLWDAKVYFPAGSGLRVDDVCEVIASPLNADEVGNSYRIKERRIGSHKTADRWNVELVVK